MPRDITWFPRTCSVRCQERRYPRRYGGTSLPLIWTRLSSISKLFSAAWQDRKATLWRGSSQALGDGNQGWHKGAEVIPIARPDNGREHNRGKTRPAAHWYIRLDLPALAGLFYPPDLAVQCWFRFYTQHFNTVEINNSFYRLPSVETFIDW